MKEVITKRNAALSLVGILSLFVILHSLILLRIVPFEVVWGGRLNNVSDMIMYEGVSIIILLFMLSIALVGGYLKTNLNPAIVRVALWLMFGIFILNTAGNLLSKSQLERMAFAPLTLMLSVLSLK